MMGQRFRSRPLSTLLPPLIGASALAVVLGCQVAAPPVAPTAAPTSGAPVRVEFDAHDYSFTTPDRLPSGLVTINLVNFGQEAHHAQLLRLNNDITFEEFVAALQQQGGEGALSLVTAAGGPGAIDPNAESEVTLDLKPGMYAVACLIPGPDGTPHLMKGMLKLIQVTDATTSSAPPQVQDTFTLKDFSFNMPDTLPSGVATYRVTNNGPQMHELNVLKLAPGVTTQDVLAWQAAPSGPPPFEAVGGINAFSADGSGYMTLDLQPGTYLAICNVPDPASGVPHAHLGMTKQFTVIG